VLMGCGYWGGYAVFGVFIAHIARPAITTKTMITIVSTVLLAFVIK
jgi:hypothetical protein